jgi:ADP-heptose:LPS heptosyltransferase
MFTNLETNYTSFKIKIINFLIKTDFKFRNWFLLGIQNLLFNNKDIFSAKKILIFRTGSIGDSICAMPAIYSVRKNFPDAKIDILTNAGTSSLVSMAGLIDHALFDEIIDYYGMKKKELFDYLEQKKYDLVIELPQNYTSVYREIRNLAAFKATNAKSAIGFEIGGTRFLAAYQQTLIKHTNERDYLISIIRKYGVKDYGLKFPLGIPDEIKNKICRLLEEKKLKNNGRNIAMVPGAKRQQNRWPVEYFQEVKNYLVKESFNILLIGSEYDIDLAQKLVGQNVFNFCGVLTPLESAEMLKHCSLTITNDTGPMHLSYAVGTPVIAFFSGRDYPGKWYPPDDGKNNVLRNYIPECVKCFNDECDNVCLKQLSPSLVIEILKKSLMID